MTAEIAAKLTLGKLPLILENALVKLPSIFPFFGRVYCLKDNLQSKFHPCTSYFSFHIKQTLPNLAALQPVRPSSFQYTQKYVNANKCPSGIFATVLGGAPESMRSGFHPPTSLISPNLPTALQMRRQYCGIASNESDKVNKGLWAIFDSKLVSIGIGTLGTASSFLAYYYFHAPEGKEKITSFAKNIFHTLVKGQSAVVKENMDQNSAALVNAEEIITEMHNLKTLFGGEDVETKIMTLMRIYEEDCISRMNKKDGEWGRTLDQNKKSHNTQIQELKNKHQQEIDSYKTNIAKISKSRDDLVKENAALRLVSKEGLNKDKLEKLDKLQFIANLYDSCPAEDQKCLCDLRKFFMPSTVLEFSKRKRFSPIFMGLVESCLKTNINESLSELNFYGTYIKDNGGLEHLINGLANNNKIVSLNLSWTSLDSDDITMIAKMLGTNNTLKNVSLSLNRNINDADATKLQDVLVKKLQDVKNNGADPKDVLVRRLDLSDTGVSDAKKQEMRDKIGIEVL